MSSATVLHLNFSCILHWIVKKLLIKFIWVLESISLVVYKLNLFLNITSLNLQS